MASELVFLVFAKTTLSDSQWRDLPREIITILEDAMGAERNEGPSSRFLEEGRVLELSFTTSSPPMTLKECAVFCHTSAMELLEKTHQVEVVMQPGKLYSLHKKPGLAVFDMDSTLIQQEVIDELARAVGLYDQVAAITEAAMRGEAPYTDFEASLRARVALLKGVRTSIWAELKAGTITFTPGARELVRVLKRLGWKTAVLSGGFTPLANWVKETLRLDYAYANYLVSDPDLNILTGELVPEAPIIHAEHKRQMLLQLAADNNIPAEQTIAVGDGSNDLLMMGVAGLGIAFHAKPKVQLAAPTRLNSSSLLDVLHVLGFTKDEVNDILEEAPQP
ncbi:hypothetical protein LTR36_010306 [Oleoguttula mirabilis]|uniref:phosphoserine phosphatase n=1 Tax=Oleoguttula mirabilis TaxID=1507867 RepID=A0AAV9J4G9_9PEZI|nr:hypothetical protein LTR36_010306 [Oleoguttula mirabilis]